MSQLDSLRHTGAAQAHLVITILAIINKILKTDIYFLVINNVGICDISTYACILYCVT